MWHAHKSSVAETKLILKKTAQSIVKLEHIVTNIQFRPL